METLVYYTKDLLEMRKKIGTDGVTEGHHNSGCYEFNNLYIHFEPGLKFDDDVVFKNCTLIELDDSISVDGMMELNNSNILKLVSPPKLSYLLLVNSNILGAVNDVTFEYPVEFYFDEDVPLHIMTTLRFTNSLRFMLKCDTPIIQLDKKAKFIYDPREHEGETDAPFLYIGHIIMSRDDLRYDVGETYGMTRMEIDMSKLMSISASRENSVVSGILDDHTLVDEIESI